jgi:hypothetical protein
MEITLELLRIDTSKNYAAVLAKVGQIEAVQPGSNFSSIDKSLDKIWIADSAI